MEENKQMVIDTSEQLKYYDPDCLLNEERNPIPGPYNFQAKDLICNQEQLIKIFNDYYEIDLSDEEKFQIKCKTYTSKNITVYTYYISTDDFESAETFLMLNNQIINEEDEEFDPVHWNCRYLLRRQSRQVSQQQDTKISFAGKRGSNINDVEYRINDRYESTQSQSSQQLVFRRGGAVKPMDSLDQIMEEEEKHTVHDFSNLTFKRGGKVGENQLKKDKRERKEQQLTVQFKRGGKVNEVGNEPRNSTTSASSKNYQNKNKYKQQYKEFNFGDKETKPIQYKRGGAQ